MENILKLIVHEIGILNTTVTGMRDEHGKKLDEHGKKLNEHGRRLENLEVSMSGMKDEHGLMLRAILESKDVQRGEIDNLQHQSALLTGTLKRAANQIIEDLKEAN